MHFLIRGTFENGLTSVRIQFEKYRSCILTRKSAEARRVSKVSCDLQTVKNFYSILSNMPMSIFVRTFEMFDSVPTAVDHTAR